MCAWGSVFPKAFVSCLLAFAFLFRCMVWCVVSFWCYSAQYAPYSSRVFLYIAPPLHAACFVFCSVLLRSLSSSSTITCIMCCFIVVSSNAIPYRTCSPFRLFLIFFCVFHDPASPLTFIPSRLPRGALLPRTVVTSCCTASSRIFLSFSSLVSFPFPSRFLFVRCTLVPVRLCHMRAYSHGAPPPKAPRTTTHTSARDVA